MLWIALFLTYPWPMDPSNQAHPVSGTLEEFRPGHLDSGVDVSGPRTLSAREASIVRGRARFDAFRKRVYT